MTKELNVSSVRSYNYKRTDGGISYLYTEIHNHPLNSVEIGLGAVHYESEATSDEVHICTDASWDAYIAKRKCIPCKVIILDTLKMVKATMDAYGYIL